MDVAGRVDGQPLDVLAVFVGRPDITEIGEGDLAGMIIGITHQLRLAGRGNALNAEEEGQASEDGSVMDVVPLR